MKERMKEEIKSGMKLKQMTHGRYSKSWVNLLRVMKN